MNDEIEFAIVALITEDGCEVSIRPSEDEDEARQEVTDRYMEAIGEIPPAHRYVKVIVRIPPIVPQETVVTATLPAQQQQPIVATVL